MDAKEKNFKNIIRLNILHFLSYTIMILFIFSIIVFGVKYALAGIHNDILTICLSLISAILIFYILRFACKSSTIGNLKNFKLSQEWVNIFLRRMNLVFILCIIGSVVFCLSYLTFDRIYLVSTINNTYAKYSIFSCELADKLIDFIITEYRKNFFSNLYSTLIIESSFIISFLSLIPYQKNILKKYNK